MNRGTVEYITKPVLFGEIVQCHDAAPTRTPTVKCVNASFQR